MDDNAAPLTMRDLARLAGVSTSAVSHAFNRPEELSPALRERILELAQEHGYRPDPRARGLRRKESSLIALVLANLASPYYAAMAYTVQQSVAAEGYHLVILDGGSETLEHGSLEAVRHERMAGAIVDAYHLDPSALQPAAGPHPVVIITDATDTHPMPKVRVNNFSAAYAATRYLAERGRRRIAHISGPQQVLAAEQRRIGYERALDELSIGLPREAVADFSFRCGRAAMQELLADTSGADAVFAANDLMALGALAELRDRGIRVPDDIAVVGFDNIEEATRSVPPLTTVDQPAATIGSAAASLLLSALREPHQNVIDVSCTLVERASA